MNLFGNKNGTAEIIMEDTVTNDDETSSAIIINQDEETTSGQSTGQELPATSQGTTFYVDPVSTTSNSTEYTVIPDTSSTNSEAQTTSSGDVQPTKVEKLGPLGLYGTETTSYDEYGNQVVTKQYRNGNSEEVIYYPDKTVTIERRHDTSAPGSREKGPVNVRVTTEYSDGRIETEYHDESHKITGAKVEKDVIINQDGTTMTETKVDSPGPNGVEERTTTIYTDEKGQEIEKETFEESRYTKIYSNTSNGGAQANIDQKQARTNIANIRSKLDKVEGPQKSIDLLKKNWTTDGGNVSTTEMQAYCNYIEGHMQNMQKAAETVQKIEIKLKENTGTRSCTCG